MASHGGILNIIVIATQKEEMEDHGDGSEGVLIMVKLTWLGYPLSIMTLTAR